MGSDPPTYFDPEKFILDKRADREYHKCINTTNTLNTSNTHNIKGGVLIHDYIGL